MNNDKFTSNLITALVAAKEAGDAIVEIYNSNFSVEKKEDNSPLTLADKRSHEIIVEHLSQATCQEASIKRHILSEEGKSIPYAERKNWEYFWLIDPLDGTKEFIKKNGEFTVNIALIHNNRPVLGVIYAPVLRVFYFAAEGMGAYKLLNDNNALSSDTLDMRKEGNREIFEKLSQKLPHNKKPASPDHSSTITVIASRSHLSPETEGYIDNLRQKYKEIEIASIGSSLKFCLVAEGRAEVYPRFGPTMEWDTAAGQAILEAAGGSVIGLDTGKSLKYNKENLVNPYFVASLARERL